MARLDLPFDLVEEILSRVPATSLTGLRFTCKQWNVLLNDPDFIKKHLNKAAKENSVLMIRNSRVYSLSVNLNEIHNPIEFTSKLGRSLNELEHVDISQVFHCNGLLLFSLRKSYKTNLVVVNPCTGQTRWIETRHDRCALGYENNNNNSFDSYKILRFPYGSNPLEIFEIKSGSWRVLANIPPNKDLRTNASGMSLKGNAYWMTLRDILSFNFTTEKFTRFNVPYQSPISDNRDISVFKEEQLLLLHSNYYTGQIDIWMSNKIDTETVFSWRKFFTLDLVPHVYYHLSNKGSFVFDQEKELVVHYRRSWDRRNNMIYVVSKHGWGKFDCDKDQLEYCYPFIFSYFPSLVSLNPPL